MPAGCLVRIRVPGVDRAERRQARRPPGLVDDVAGSPGPFFGARCPLQSGVTRVRVDAGVDERRFVKASKGM